MFLDCISWNRSDARALGLWASKLPGLHQLLGPLLCLQRAQQDTSGSLQTILGSADLAVVLCFLISARTSSCLAASFSSGSKTPKETSPNAQIGNEAFPRRYAKRGLSLCETVQVCCQNDQFSQLAPVLPSGVRVKSVTSRIPAGLVSLETRLPMTSQLLFELLPRSYRDICPSPNSNLSAVCTVSRCTGCAHCKRRGP